MADFPALAPTVRPLTPGRFGGVTHRSMAGNTSGIRRSSAEIGRGLSLRFENITEAQFLQIVDHYRGQRSSLDGFNFTSTTIPTAYTPSGHTWVYNSKPQVVDRHADAFVVELEVRSEPRGIFRVSGTPFIVQPALAAGALTAIVSGLAISRTPVLAVGSPTAIVSGAALQSGIAVSTTKLLLHGDGADGSTTFVDSSGRNLTITANGNAQIDTAQSQFGGSSMLFDGTGDFLSFDAVNIGANDDATIEAWIRPTAINDRAIFGHSNTATNIQPLSILNNAINAFWGGNQVTVGAISANVWTHVAITRASGVIRAFVGGTLTHTPSGTNTATLAIDRIGRGQFRGDFNGWIDEARIVVGEALYTTSFTPAGPFDTPSSITPGAPTAIISGASYASTSPSLTPGAPV